MEQLRGGILTVLLAILWSWAAHHAGLSNRSSQDDWWFAITAALWLCLASGWIWWCHRSQPNSE
jgi:H+/Cl- antiporter ClcA